MKTLATIILIAILMSCNSKAGNEQLPKSSNKVEVLNEEVDTYYNENENSEEVTTPMFVANTINYENQGIKVIIKQNGEDCYVRSLDNYQLAMIALTAYISEQVSYKVVKDYHKNQELQSEISAFTFNELMEEFVNHDKFFYNLVNRLNNKIELDNNQKSIVKAYQTQYQNIYSNPQNLQFKRGKDSVMGIMNAIKLYYSNQYLGEVRLLGLNEEQFIF